MNNRGQLAGYEALIIIILLGYSGYMTFLWANKANETKIFRKGSASKDATYAPHLGCVNVKVDEYMEGAKIDKNNPINASPKPSEVKPK